MTNLRLSDLFCLATAANLVLETVYHSATSPLDFVLGSLVLTAGLVVVRGAMRYVDRKLTA